VRLPGVRDHVQRLAGGPQFRYQDLGVEAIDRGRSPCTIRIGLWILPIFSRVSFDMPL
jgi:hypothetical protein